MRAEAPAFAPPPAPTGGEASEADLLAALMSKRDELQRMQTAIKQLESMGPTEEDEVEEDLEYEDEEFEQDDEDEDEPGSQEEWMLKLM